MSGKALRRLASSIVPDIPVRPPSVHVPSAVPKRSYRTVENLAEGEGLSRQDTVVLSGWGAPAKSDILHSSAFDFLKGKPPEFQDYYMRSYNLLNNRFKKIQAAINTGKMTSEEGAEAMSKYQREHIQNVRSVGQKYLGGHDVGADLKPELFPRYLMPESKGGPALSRGFRPMRPIEDLPPGEQKSLLRNIQNLEDSMMREPYPFN